MIMNRASDYLSRVQPNMPETTRKQLLYMFCEAVFGYYNFSFDSYICYEVEGSQVKITTYTGIGSKKCELW